MIRVSRGILRISSILLVVVSVFFMLLLIGQTAFEPFHVVMSDSMAPQIEKGDAVVVSKLESSDVEVGDVVIFRNPSDEQIFVIHRVVAIEKDGPARFLTTKGDNNELPDKGKVPGGEVVGGVGVVVPGFGDFLDFLGSPKGYLSLIAIPAVVALALALVLSLMEKIEDAYARKQAASPYLPETTSE